MTQTADDRLSRIRKRLHRIEIGTRRLSSESSHGVLRSRFLGRGMDFDEISEYTPGDDVRAIDWNATARAGRPFVKRYREERQLTVVLVVDMSASGAVGSARSKQDQAVELAGVLALGSQQQDHRVGLALFTEGIEHYVPPGRGRAHIGALVNTLVRFEPESPGTNLAAVLDNLRDRLRRRSVIVILSDFLLSENAEEQALKSMRALSQRHDVVTIQVGDVNDRKLPVSGLLTLEDAETGEVVEVDLGSRSQRARFEHSAQEAHERGLALRRKAQVDNLVIDSQAQHFGEVLGFFKRRGVRA